MGFVHGPWPRAHCYACRTQPICHDLLSREGKPCELLTQPPLQVEGPGASASATCVSAVSRRVDLCSRSERPSWPLSPGPQVQAEDTSGDSGSKPFPLKTLTMRPQNPFLSPACGPPSLGSREGFELTAPWRMASRWVHRSEFLAPPCADR